MATETQESTAPAEPASGGLPQFDFQWWPGQIVWFLVIFLLVLLFVRLFVSPRVGGTIDAREGKISGDINAPTSPYGSTQEGTVAGRVLVVQGRFLF